MSALNARLVQGALEIAEEARTLAAAWSDSVPPSIEVIDGGGDTVIVASGVGPSYPNEVRGVRHPVFGNREVWVTNEYRPFLAPAAEGKADAVAVAIARVVDDWGAELGFREVP